MRKVNLDWSPGAEREAWEGDHLTKRWRKDIPKGGSNSICKGLNKGKTSLSSRN